MFNGRVEKCNYRILCALQQLWLSFTAFEESVGGVSYEIKAEVGLLSRNIRIIGADYSDMFSESFGARVIVGMQTELDENGDPKPHVGEYL